MVYSSALEKRHASGHREFESHFLRKMYPFIFDNILTTLVSSFFTVIGGALPIAFLIYLFSIKERKNLKILADEIEKTIPLQQKLLDKIIELNDKNPNLQERTEQFWEILKNATALGENKKFIEYAKGYNYISAIGNVLRANNYIPKNIQEHKEISKSYIK